MKIAWATVQLVKNFRQNHVHAVGSLLLIEVLQITYCRLRCVARQRAIEQHVMGVVTVKVPRYGQWVLFLWRAGDRWTKRTVPRFPCVHDSGHIIFYIANVVNRLITNRDMLRFLV